MLISRWGVTSSGMPYRETLYKPVHTGAAHPNALPGVKILFGRDGIE